MLSWYNVHVILVNIELIIVIHCFSLNAAKWEEDFLYFVKLPLVFVCSYTSTLRVCVKATDPPAGAETCSDTDPASTQTIVLNSSSSKSDIALAFSSHGFHTTKIKSKLHCKLGKLFLVHTVLLRYIKHVLFPF